MMSDRKSDQILMNKQ